jgi:formylglycine-generating enzyme required for sulfatase activity
MSRTPSSSADSLRGNTSVRTPPTIAWYANNGGRQRLDRDRFFEADLAKYPERLKQNGNGTHEVGQRRANGFGLYDMLGNAAEWVNDLYDENYYQRSPAQDPAGPPRGQGGALRGGDWARNPGEIRVSSRLAHRQTSRFPDNGFRRAEDGSAP